MNANYLLIGLGVSAIIACAFMFYPLRKQRYLLCIWVPSMLSAIALAYWQWGNWPALQQFQIKERQQQEAQALLHKIKGPQALIARLHARLTEDPKSARGWYLLGRLHAAQGQWQEAEVAFKRAWILQPHDVPTIINYAQSISAQHQQNLNVKTRQMLQAVLDREVNQPDALILLAVDAYVNKHYANAINYWQRLLPLIPAQSEEGKLVRKAIARAENELAQAKTSL